MAGSGETPDRPVAGTVRDHLNVGDLDDEARHAWTSHPPVQGLQPVSSVARTVVAPRRTVADSGRRVVGGETLTLDGLTPGRPVTLTSRVGPDPERPDPEARAVRVGVDGRPAGQWDLTGPGDVTWVQSSFVIPAELVTSSRLTVSTGPLQDFLGPYPAYTAYGYWASQ